MDLNLYRTFLEVFVDKQFDKIEATYEMIGFFLDSHNYCIVV